jgi:hypothetical protein
MRMVLTSKLLQIQPREREQGRFGTSEERRPEQQHGLQRQPQQDVGLRQQCRIEVKELPNGLEILDQELWKGL